MGMVCSCCNKEKSAEEFYSRKDRNGKQYYCKVCYNKYQTERWIARKLKAIEIMGGQCSICGYDKNYGALHLHHREPGEKEYGWPQVCKMAWEKILAEINKCILVCANCHAEIHWPQCTLNREVDVPYMMEKKEPVPTGKCYLEGCDNDVYNTKYCSRECSYHGARKISRPSRDTLLKDLETMSYVAVGKKYGVSDNSIRKWLD